MSLLDTFIPDRLPVGGVVRTDETILKSGQNLKRGAVLGKVRFTCPTTGTLAGTGNGTCTLVKGKRNLKVGTYTISVTSLLATGAVFSVSDPDSLAIGSLIVGLGNADYADFANDQISFRITNQSADFDATSVFTIAVAGYIPATAAVTGTGNGTMPQVEPRRQTERGAYLATCSAAATNAYTFAVTDPSGNSLGSINASYRHNGSGAATGTGALTEIKAGPLFKKGSYLIKCTTAATNGGTFSVTDPDGTVIGSFSLPGTSTGVATFWHEQISFKLADATDFVENDEIVLNFFESDGIAFVIWQGATPFIVGDFFTMTCAIADEESVIVNADNTDGSAFPWAVLAEDTDASSAAKKAPVYISGQFNERALYFGGNDTIETHRDRLREIGIFTSSSVAAGN